MSENFEPSHPTNMSEKSAIISENEEEFAEKNVPSAEGAYVEDNKENKSNGGMYLSSLGSIAKENPSTSGRVSSGYASRRTVGGTASNNLNNQAHNSAKSSRTPRARRMSLSLVRVDAWSVAKVTFLLSVAGGIIQVIAAGLVWLFLNMVGVFDQVTQIVSSTGLDSNGFNLADVFSLPTVLSAVTIFSIVEIVIVTILSAIIALLYNVVGSLVGGIHITLGDD